MLSSLYDRANGPVYKNPDAVAFQGRSFASLANEQSSIDQKTSPDPSMADRSAGYPAKSPAVGAGSFVFQVPLMPMALPSCDIAAFVQLQSHLHRDTAPVTRIFTAEIASWRL